ncbi:trehalose receptor domain-containing protein [Phthorimaea operculella]|nr:trehalose receptor domain-containing protein [Phthorimaea operculella]
MCNARFGIYILVSFGFNLYWICMQLFNSLNKKNTGHIITFDCDEEVLNNTLHGIEHGIYFTFSFSFLVARTLLVILSAARVNHTSLAPLMLLYEVEPARYNAELVGSIITYELVLLQFNK